MMGDQDRGVRTSLKLGTAKVELEDYLDTLERSGRKSEEIGFESVAGTAAEENWCRGSSKPTRRSSEKSRRKKRGGPCGLRTPSLNEIPNTEELSLCLQLGNGEEKPAKLENPVAENNLAEDDDELNREEGEGCPPRRRYQKKGHENRTRPCDNIFCKICEVRFKDSEDTSLLCKIREMAAVDSSLKVKIIARSRVQAQKNVQKAAADKRKDTEEKSIRDVMPVAVVHQMDTFEAFAQELKKRDVSSEDTTRQVVAWFRLLRAEMSSVMQGSNAAFSLWEQALLLEIEKVCAKHNIRIATELKELCTRRDQTQQTSDSLSPNIPPFLDPVKHLCENGHVPEVDTSDCAFHCRSETSSSATHEGEVLDAAELLPRQSPVIHKKDKAGEIDESNETQISPPVACQNGKKRDYGSYPWAASVVDKYLKMLTDASSRVPSEQRNASIGDKRQFQLLWAGGNLSRHYESMQHRAKRAEKILNLLGLKPQPQDLKDKIVELSWQYKLERDRTRRRFQRVSSDVMANVDFNRIRHELYAAYLHEKDNVLESYAEQRLRDESVSETERERILDIVGPPPVGIYVRPTVGLYGHKLENSESTTLKIAEKEVTSTVTVAEKSESFGAVLSTDQKNEPLFNKVKQEVLSDDEDGGIPMISFSPFLHEEREESAQPPPTPPIPRAKKRKNGSQKHYEDDDEWMPVCAKSRRSSRSAHHNQSSQDLPDLDGDSPPPLTAQNVYPSASVKASSPLPFFTTAPQKRCPTTTQSSHSPSPITLAAQHADLGAPLIEDPHGSDTGRNECPALLKALTEPPHEIVSTPQSAVENPDCTDELMPLDCNFMNGVVPLKSNDLSEGEEADWNDDVVITEIPALVDDFVELPLQAVPEHRENFFPAPAKQECPEPETDLRLCAPQSEPLIPLMLLQSPLDYDLPGTSNRRSLSSRSASRCPSPAGSLTRMSPCALRSAVVTVSSLEQNQKTSAAQPPPDSQPVATKQMRRLPKKRVPPPRRRAAKSQMKPPPPSDNGIVLTMPSVKSEVSPAPLPKNSILIELLNEKEPTDSSSSGSESLRDGRRPASHVGGDPSTSMFPVEQESLTPKPEEDAPDDNESRLLRMEDGWSTQKNRLKHARAEYQNGPTPCQMIEQMRELTTIYKFMKMLVGMEMKAVPIGFLPTMEIYLGVLQRKYAFDLNELVAQKISKGIEKRMKFIEDAFMKLLLPKKPRCGQSAPMDCVSSHHSVSQDTSPRKKQAESLETTPAREETGNVVSLE